jgi:hypothetical protein
MNKKPKKSMDKLTENFEEFAKSRELNKNNKEPFNEGIKKLVKKKDSSKES